MGIIFAAVDKSSNFGGYHIFHQNPKIWGEFWIGIISAKKYLTVCCQLGCNLR